MVDIFLGKSNINKEENRESAQKGQNLSSMINIFSVLINLMINSLGMKKIGIEDF
jgi:hypothetical protein